VSLLESRLRLVARAVSDACASEARPRVLGLESVFPLVASGQWLPDMRQRAGGIDALGGVPGDAPRRLEWEEVLSSAPDVIVICCCGKTAEEAVQEVAAHFLSQARVWNLPAMRASPPRFYVTEHGPFSRPGVCTATRCNTLQHSAIHCSTNCNRL